MTKASNARRARKSAPAAAVVVIDRAALVASGDALPTRTVAVPELGGEVKIRKLDAGARLDFQRFLRTNANNPERVELLALRLVASMLINADGSRMFSDSEADLELLRRMNPDAFVRILDACGKFANIDTPVADAAKN